MLELVVMLVLRLAHPSPSVAHAQMAAGFLVDEACLEHQAACGDVMRHDGEPVYCAGCAGRQSVCGGAPPKPNGSSALGEQYQCGGGCTAITGKSAAICVEGTAAWACTVANEPPEEGCVQVNSYKWCC